MPLYSQQEENCLCQHNLMCRVTRFKECKIDLYKLLLILSFAISGKYVFLLKLAKEENRLVRSASALSILNFALQQCVTQASWVIYASVKLMAL